MVQEHRSHLTAVFHVITLTQCLSSTICSFLPFGLPGPALTEGLLSWLMASCFVMFGCGLRDLLFSEVNKGRGVDLGEQTQKGIERGAERSGERWNGGWDLLYERRLFFKKNEEIRWRRLSSSQIHRL